MSRSLYRCLLLCGLLFLLPAIGSAQDSAAQPEDAADRTLDVERWLLLGPVATPLPAFHDADKGGYALKDILARKLSAGGEWPAEGERLPLVGRPDARWNPTAAPVRLEPDTDHPAEAWLAVYLDADRWLEADLRLEGPAHVVATLDGEKVSLKDEKGEDGEAPAHEASLELGIGKHLLLLHVVAGAADSCVWTVAGSLEVSADLPAEALAVTIDPQRRVDIHDVLNAPRFGALALSSDGELVACRLSEYDDDGNRSSWLEVRRTDDGELVTRWRGGLDIGGLQWAPMGRRLSYTARQDGKTTVWLHDLDAGSTTVVVGGIEDFGGYAWAPDASFLIYSFSVDAEPDKRRVKRVKDPNDRQSWARNRSYLVQVALPDGAARRLTAGPVSVSNWRISPDGRELLFFRSEPDLTARPYFTSELWVMDLRTLDTERLLDDRWIASAAYGPDPDLLALGGSPSAFDGLGRNLPEGVQANDYGGQLYLYNRRTGQAEAASVDFAPAIGSFEWSRMDGRIYAQCGEGQYRKLFAFDPSKQDWVELDAGLDIVARYALATEAETAVAWGSSATQPFRLTAVDLKKGRSRLLLEPGAEHYRHVRFGEVRPWPVELPGGEVLDGFVYYPPDFDPARKYPLIVYYYGGTSPVTRDYGGRYPKNVWAGQGYVVYVPEPSGATGYGQEFAARHVNDWGKLTAAEVIEGTKLFLATHSFVDPERVGCIGASYGGFLTEYIVTRTDLFAAAVSHAGISDISSYWGEGMWGYAYGARALANAFPWADRELYVEQSPLFHADRITTPLLLVHGDSDVNVPKGESDQLFTALKLLGREVEYVQIVGQDHHILDHEQRVVWNDTILAFFAKWLKERDAWWSDMYPDE